MPRRARIRPDLRPRAAKLGNRARPHLPGLLNCDIICDIILFAVPANHYKPLQVRLTDFLALGYLLQIDAFCCKPLQVRKPASASLRGWCLKGCAGSSPVRSIASLYVVLTCRRDRKRTSMNASGKRSSLLIYQCPPLVWTVEKVCS